jgi:hypothetical protein
LFVGVFTSPNILRAAPLSLHITTTRTEHAMDCADSTRLYTKVQQLSPLALVNDSTSQQAVRVTAHFDKRGDAYSANVEFTGVKPGERRFQDRGMNCESLENAVATAIALLLDTENQLREPSSKVVYRVESTLKLSPIKLSVRERSLQTHEWTLSAKGGPLWNGAGAPLAWFAMDVGLNYKSTWQVELGGFTHLPKTVGYGQGEVVLSLIAAELRGCKIWGRSFWFGACVSQAIGRLHGAGKRFDESTSSNLLFSALGGTLTLQVPLGRRWFGGFEAGTWVPLADQTFSVDNLGTAWNSAVIWGFFATRLGVRFQ